MQSNEKYLELAKKLNELAKQGVGGEKENAKKMLDQLCEKHGITLDQIETEEEFIYDFKTSDNPKIFLQIVAKVCGWDRIQFYTCHKKGYESVKCTASEGVEIEAMFNFYMIKFKEDLKIFQDAFIQKNSLFPSGQNPHKIRIGDDGKTAEDRRKEKELAWKVANMTQGLDRHQFLKQIK